MPKEIEQALKKAVKKKSFGKKRAGAYVYGTMAKIEKKMKKGKWMGTSDGMMRRK